MKRLSISVLVLLFACPVWGATALEIYHTEGESEVVVTTDAWTTHNAALAVDRSGEAGTKEFFILAHFNVSTDSTTTESHFRLLTDLAGTQTASTSTTVMTDSTAAFATATGGIVGFTIFNTTDASQCIITANTATTATCGHGLEGGSENDWDTSDAYVVAVAAIGVDATDVNIGVLDEGKGSDSVPSSNGAGYPTISISRRITLSNASTHTFTWQGANANATSNMNLQNSSIVVIERSANAEYADSYSAENWNTENGMIVADDDPRVDLISLSFTATAEVWVIIFNMDWMTEDESDGGCDGPTWARETSHGTIDTLYGFADNCQVVTSVNDDRTFSQGGLGLETLTAATHRFVIEWDGGGGTVPGADDSKASRASIIAFPVSDFENAYTDCNGESALCSTDVLDTSLDSYTDTSVDLDAQSITASKTHLVLAGWMVASASVNSRGSVRLHVDGDAQIMRNMDDRSTGHPGFAAYAKDTTATSATFKLELISNSASNNAEARDQYMVVLEVPDGGAPPAARRRLNVIMGGQQ